MNHARTAFLPIADSRCQRLPVGGRIKRYFDVLVTGFIVIVLAPVFILLSIALKCTDKGPLLYKHPRIGRDGREFNCFKFRTMAVDSETRLKLLLDRDPHARAEWAKDRKLKNDPRVTPFRLILRRFSADELPQLINVLRGDMSLVGPRPVVTEELERYGDNVALYFLSRPGITGIWQVSGRSNCSYEHRVALDAHYVRNWTFANDLLILLNTVGAVIGRKGAC
ncbi:sugar transferase [Methylocella silvestris]|uniref:Exopolysaccharide biosynthesis protein n=1 Tax=Methylocella silvestris TaxID=199596 RepID=A0A2J7TDA5_METSI|nr:sugar transferase [Methylocella silvestris]PNG24756.1 exopolysaccharide biosynthesis protein [Methylocella silvestris]